MNKIIERLLGSAVWSPADAGGGTVEPPKDGGDGKAPDKSSKLPGDGSNGKDGDKTPTVFTGLKDADNLEYVKSKNWQSEDDAVKSYRELETAHSKTKSLKLPTKESTPEEVDTFYNQLGRPEKPDGYEFQLSDKVPENFPYEEDKATAFKTVAHKARLTGEQAQALHDWYVDTMAGQYTGSLNSAKERIEGAHDVIVKQLGNPEGSQYKRGIELADRALRELDTPNDKGGLRKELVEIGAITPDNKVMAPKLVLALSKIGEALYSEDKVYSGVSATNNPWKKESENLTVQGKILQDDPEQARQLILAANLDPKDFGLGPKAP